MEQELDSLLIREIIFFNWNSVAGKKPAKENKLVNYWVKDSDEVRK